MLTILAIALLVFVGLVALTWVGTLWAQGYFYDSTVDSLYWRAPAAAGAIALFLLLWMVLEFKRPSTADTLFRFSSEHADEFDRFISVRKDAEGEREVAYEKRRLQGGKIEFLDDKGTPWARSKSGMMVAIILEEKVDGDDKPQRHRFNAPLSPDGKTFAAGAQQPVVYREEGGPRVIVENQLGRAVRNRPGRMIGNILVNVLFFALWFMALWLLLRFQWPHALLGAAACYLVLSLALLPFMLDRAHDAGKRRPAARASAMRFPEHRFAASISGREAALAKARGETG